MKTYTLNQRIRDTKRNKTLGYVLADKDGNIINVTSDQLKQAMRAGQVQVKGLTLTRDGRLFIKTEKVQEPDFSKEKQPAAVKKAVAQKPVVQTKKKEVEADKHRFEIVAQVIVNSKPVGYIMLNEYRNRQAGVGINFVFRDEIKNYDTNMIGDKIIWRDAAKARRIQKVLSETVRSMIPNKGMNFEYDLQIEYPPEDCYRHEFIEIACREAKICFDELNDHTDPLKYFMQAVKKNNPDGLDKYKKYCVDKMISVLGTMQLTQDILGDNEYMYDMLNNNYIEDFYTKYLEEQEWLIQVIYQICHRNNYSILGNDVYYHTNDSGDISIAVEKAINKTVLLSLLDDPKSGCGDIKQNYNKMYEACEGVIRHFIKDEEQLNKTIFRITEQSSIYDDDTYSDTGIFVYGYKNALHEYMRYLYSSLTDIFGEYEGRAEDYDDMEAFLESRKYTTARLINDKVSIRII